MKKSQKRCYHNEKKYIKNKVFKLYEKKKNIIFYFLESSSIVNTQV